MMEDEREEELTALSSIFPEINVDPHNPHKFSLAIPVAPVDAIEITFEQTQKVSIGSVQDIAEEKRVVRHLPPLVLTATLGDRYPADTFPLVDIDITPAWLDFAKLKELENACGKLWEEYGRCQIMFTYIDYVQQAAERMLDLGREIRVSGKLKDALIEYDSARDKELFANRTYDCGVCLEPKRGSVCHRMTACGHVFCRPCLQDFYNSAITEGDVTRIKCLDTTCGKGKSGAPKKSGSLHPRELLAIGISEPTARRFVEIKRKKKLEADKLTVFCPREWCQSAARSSKYPSIPENLEEYVDSDYADNDASSPPPTFTKDTPERSLPAPADRLAICSNAKCSLAFCRVCYAGWHGEFARCWPRNPAELSAEERASYDYIRLNTSPCPTCSSPTQKTMGCNHMKCFQCNTHFCYLCGAWLDANNPYQHFNNKANDCFMKLWELEEGDEGQGGAFEGARRWEAEARAIAAADGHDNDDDHDHADDNNNRDNDEGNNEPARLPLIIPGLVAQDAQAARQPPAQEQVRIPAGAGAAPPNAVRPPPGPIDPMHARALELEAMRLEDPPPPAQPLYIADAYPERDRPDDAPRPRRGGWAVRGQQQQQQPRGGGRAGRGGAADIAGRDGRRAPQHRGGRVGHGDARPPLINDAWEERQQAAIRRFVEMAERDMEDEWDSDELEDDEQRFEIRVGA